MSNRKRVAERNIGAFLSPDLPIPLPPMNALNDGPGKPGPGDDWKFPTGPLNEVDGEEEVSLEPVHSNGTVVLPLHPTDKG
jgi:hypothetical protein